MHSNKKDTPEKYIWQLESKWPRFTHRLRMQLSMIHICLSKTLSVCFSQLVNVLSEEQKPNFSSSRNFNLKIKKNMTNWIRDFFSEKTKLYWELIIMIFIQVASLELESLLCVTKLRIIFIWSSLLTQKYSPLSYSLVIILSVLLSKTLREKPPYFNQWPILFLLLCTLAWLPNQCYSCIPHSSQKVVPFSHL